MIKRSLGRAWAILIIAGMIVFSSVPSLAAGLPNPSQKSLPCGVTLIKIADGTDIKMVNTADAPLVLDKPEYRYKPAVAGKSVSVNNDVKIMADDVEIDNVIVGGDLYIYGKNARLSRIKVGGTVYTASGQDVAMVYCSIAPEKIKILEDDEEDKAAFSGEVYGSKLADAQDAAADNPQTVKEGPAVALLETVAIDDYNSTYVLANKSRLLPAGWKPKDLAAVAVPYRGRSAAKYLRKEASDALTMLFAAAKKDGIELCGISGFRSYELQKSVYYKYTRQLGEKTAEMVSAKAGSSEHQTGLAIDISSKTINYALSNSFANTREGKWLAKNAAGFGFILRYPKGKEAITGYMYEPWHFRYIGRELAADIAKKGLTLEEYYGLVPKDIGQKLIAGVPRISGT